VTETSENKAKQQARDAAVARLREAHEDEFAGYMHEEHAKRGVTWNPRLSPEQKARKEIERLAKEFGIPLAFDVQSTEDAVANTDIQRAAFEAGNGRTGYESSSSVTGPVAGTALPVPEEATETAPEPVVDNDPVF